MINVADGQRCRVFEVEDKGNYSLVKLSTWRKDKRSDKYVYSNWSYVRFVGKAHEKIDLLNDLEVKNRIVLKGAGLAKEKYTDNTGQEVYPKFPQLTVFNFEMLEDQAPGTGYDRPPRVEEDDFPFS